MHDLRSPSRHLINVWCIATNWFEFKRHDRTARAYTIWKIFSVTCFMQFVISFAFLICAKDPNPNFLSNLSIDPWKNRLTKLHLALMNNAIKKEMVMLKRIFVRLSNSGFMECWIHGLEATRRCADEPPLVTKLSSNGLKENVNPLKYQKAWENSQDFVSSRFLQRVLPSFFFLLKRLFLACLLLFLGFYNKLENWRRMVLSGETCLPLWFNMNIEMISRSVT